MEQKTDHQEYFDEISEEYDSYYENPKIIMDFEKVHRLERALSMADFSTDDQILNVGVGSGELNRALPADQTDKVIGLDFSRAMLELAQTDDEPMLQAAIQQLPLVDGSVDCCFCLGVVGYLDTAELDDALSELYRVIAPGGELIFTFGNRRSPFRWFRNAYYYRFLNTIKRITGFGEPLIHKYNTYDPRRVQRIATEYGFHIVKRAYLTYSSGVFDTSLNHLAYRTLEEQFGENDRVGQLAMTWVLKLRKTAKNTS